MAQLAQLVVNERPDAGLTRSAEHPCFCPHGGLIAKSSFEFREQVRDLLRSRLRVAAIVLFVALAAHFVRSALTAGELFSLAAGSMILLLVITAVEGAFVIVLCARHRPPMLVLRAIEVVMFGLPALLLVHLQAEQARGSPMADAESEGLRLLAFSVPWILLLNVYGLFIPNTWKRATAVVSLLAMGPLMAAWRASHWHPPLMQSLFDSGAISFNLLQMSVAAVVAIWGSHRFGTLRREAFDLKHVGVYTLMRPLGSGGMGEVFLAEHRLLKRPCAVKLIRPDRAGDDASISRFQNEVQATARLTHPNTVEIYDYGVTDNGMFFYVMEYLPGLSLQEIVERTGPLPPGRVIHLLRQVCSALSEAHRAGLIHRDLKPGNIIAAERGGIHDFAKLLDFGLVKSTGPVATNVLQTREGVVVGSPLYAAPETVMGERVDGRADIYSLGATAYFLLTGQPVFAGTRALDIVFAHAKESPIPPSRHAPVPADLEAIVLRCLAKAPEERYASVDELEQALSACGDAGTWTARAATEWWERMGHADGLPRPAPDAVAFAATTVSTPVLAGG